MRMSKFVEEFALSKADVENWISRLPMRTEFAPTIAGRFREFGKANVLELALVGAFVSAGMRPASAVAWAEPVLDDYRSGSVQRWFVAPAGSFDKGSFVPDLEAVDLDGLSKLYPSRAIVVFNILDIVERVDALFRSEGQ